MLFRFTERTFSGWETLRADEIRTLWNTIFNDSVDLVYNHSIDGGIAGSSSSTRQLEEYLHEGATRMWVEKWSALLNVWPTWIAELLHLNGAYNNELWIARSRGCFSLTGTQWALQCFYNNFKIVIPDQCLGCPMIASGEEQASHFTCLGFQMNNVLKCTGKPSNLKDSLNKVCTKFRNYFSYWKPEPIGGSSWPFVPSTASKGRSSQQGWC